MNQSKSAVLNQSKSPVSFIDSVFNFLSSLKLAIPLIVLVAIASILGTVVVQRNLAEPGQIERLYAPATIKLFNMLGFFNVYQSWWFIGLLVLLSLNLIFCTIDLVPRSMEFVKNPKKDITEHYIEGQPFKNKFNVYSPMEVLRDRISQAFNKHKLSAVRTDFPDRTVFFAQRNLWWRFTVYFIHAALLVILAGGILTFRFGYSGFAPLIEGEETDKFFLRTEEGKQDARPLGFELQCTETRFDFRNDLPGFQFDRLNAEQVKSVGLVHAWYSDLVIRDHGSTIPRTVKVNDPWNYKQYKIFQASFGITADIKHLTVGYKKKGAPDSEAKELTIKPGETVKLPDTNFSLRLAQFIPDFTLSQTKQPVSRSGDYWDPPYDQPAAKLDVITGDGKILDKWAFLHMPWFDTRQNFDYLFSLKEIRPKYYTGLQIAHHPGMHVATVGAAMLALALVLRFYFSHKRYWVIVKPEGDHYKLLVGGHTGRNKASFESKFNKFVSDLKTEVNTDPKVERTMLKV